MQDLYQTIYNSSVYLFTQRNFKRILVISNKPKKRKKSKNKEKLSKIKVNKPQKQQEKCLTLQTFYNKSKLMPVGVDKTTHLNTKYP